MKILFRKVGQWPRLHLLLLQVSRNMLVKDCVFKMIIRSENEGRGSGKGGNRRNSRLFGE